MIIGFTGTRKGMTTPQIIFVEQALSHYTPKEFHHGDCVGADAQAHEIAMKLNIPIIIHPPRDEKARAFKKGALKIMPPNEYLVRNKAIIMCCDLMIVTPDTQVEKLRSGTWATFRAAKKVKRDCLIILPDGLKHFYNYT